MSWIRRWSTFFRKKFVYVLLLVVSFVFAMFQGGFVSWFLFYSFLPFAIYTFLLQFHSMKNIEVRRSFKRDEYSYGDMIEVEITVIRKSAFPLVYLIVEDQVPERFLTQFNLNHKFIFFPLWKQEFQFSYTIPSAIRGEHDFNNVILKTGDILGFYTKETRISCFNRLLVFPHYERITYKQLEAVYEEGQNSSPVRNYNEAAIVSGIREYSPGDRMSWIHWKATARKNEIMTKEFEERKSQDVVLILNQDFSPVFEEMVSVTASLAHAILQKGVGVAYVGTNDWKAGLHVGRGEQHKKRILYSLAKVNNHYERSLLSFFEYSQMFLLANASCLIVTSSVNKELISALVEMKGNVSIHLIILLEKQDMNHELEKNIHFAQRSGIVCRRLFLDRWKYAFEEGIADADITI